ncbi:MAG TPA: DUF2207 domain-containing protein [Caldilineae bacterium]|nr:DUF2207 domain-containing protein [Caldilineae bacterium]
MPSCLHVLRGFATRYLPYAAAFGVEKAFLAAWEEDLGGGGAPGWWLLLQTGAGGGGGGFG